MLAPTNRSRAQVSHFKQYVTPSYIAYNEQDCAGGAERPFSPISHRNGATWAKLHTPLPCWARWFLPALPHPSTAYRHAHERHVRHARCMGTVASAHLESGWGQGSWGLVPTRYDEDPGYDRMTTETLGMTVRYDRFLLPRSLMLHDAQGRQAANEQQPGAFKDCTAYNEAAFPRRTPLRHTQSGHRMNIIDTAKHTNRKNERAVRWHRNHPVTSASLCSQSWLIPYCCPTTGQKVSEWGWPQPDCRPLPAPQGQTITGPNHEERRCPLFLSEGEQQQRRTQGNPMPRRRTPCGA